MLMNVFMIFQEIFLVLLVGFPFIRRCKNVFSKGRFLIVDSQDVNPFPSLLGLFLPS